MVRVVRSFLFFTLLSLSVACFSVQTESEVHIATPEPKGTVAVLSAPGGLGFTPVPLATYNSPLTQTVLPLFVDSEALIQMVRLARPAVVRILQSRGVGSGVIYRTDGQEAYVLTNAHVLAASGPTTVIVNDTTSYTADVVGKDSQMDLAVLRICCGAFTALPFGSVPDIKPGLQIVNMGYALDLPGENNHNHRHHLRCKI